MKRNEKDVEHIEGRSIKITHSQKLYFPHAHITKKMVIDYYKKIAPYFLPLAKNYMMVLRRFPEGITGINFFQKQVPEYLPDWIKNKTVELRKGENQTLVIVDDGATLIYLANQGTLEFHSWLSTSTNAHLPRKLVFDLDPPHNSDLSNLRFGARALKTILQDHGLVPFLMTTGSRGYHVVVPLVPTHSFEEIHTFAKSIATSMAEAHPNHFTTEMNIKKRGEKVFIDYLRNSYGQTSIACYSLRAQENAPIATPLDWNELSRTKPKQYTINNIFRRLAQKVDPWGNFEKSARELVIKDIQ